MAVEARTLEQRAGVLLAAATAHQQVAGGVRRQAATDGGGRYGRAVNAILEGAPPASWGPNGPAALAWAEGQFIRGGVDLGRFGGPKSSTLADVLREGLGTVRDGLEAGSDAIDAAERTATKATIAAAVVGTVATVAAYKTGLLGRFVGAVVKWLT